MIDGSDITRLITYVIYGCEAVAMVRAKPDEYAAALEREAAARRAKIDAMMADYDASKVQVADKSA